MAIFNDSSTKKVISVKQFQQKGGNTTVKRYGSQHMSDIAKKSRKAIVEKYGEDFYVRLAKKGLDSRLKKKRDSNRSSVDKLTDILIGKK